jgi:hypothetical protein
MNKPFLFVAVVSILLYIFLVFDSQNGFGVKPAEAAQPNSKFEVIAQYKGCDVVRMDISTLATYKYFLDCTDELLMGMPYGTTSIKARKEKYD